jgi:hypothetical protein
MPAYNKRLAKMRGAASFGQFVLHQYSAVDTDAAPQTRTFASVDRCVICKEFGTNFIINKMANLKTVFLKPFQDFENTDANNQLTFEFHNKIKLTGDHRSRVILSGIIVEYHIDRLLKILFIDYKHLTEKSEFTFSFKISLLKSLRIIPQNILTNCDCIRKVRNEFAHNLGLEIIDNLDQKILSNVIQCFSDLKSNSNIKSHIGRFESIHFFTTGYLRSYEQNFRLLREKMDSEEFIDGLEKLNQERTFKSMDELIKKGPINIIEKGGKIEEYYKNNFVVVRNKIHLK